MVVLGGGGADEVPSFASSRRRNGTIAIAGAEQRTRTHSPVAEPLAVPGSGSLGLPARAPPVAPAVIEPENHGIDGPHEIEPAYGWRSSGRADLVPRAACHGRGHALERPAELRRAGTDDLDPAIAGLLRARIAEIEG